MSIWLERFGKWINDLFYIWRQEFRQAVKDEGVLIFFFITPLVYPLLYSWIYTNETVREVPVCVVDQSHTQMSRRFVRMCDASPDVKVLCYAQDLDEAKSLVGRQAVKGIYLIPSDFEKNVNRMEPTAVSVYCDMSLMLAYKAVYQTALSVSMEMGHDIQVQLTGNYTTHEDDVSLHPLEFDDVALFNPAGGYGSSVLPGVLLLILQQTLLLGIGMSAGTTRENTRHHRLIPISRPYQNAFRIVFGKALCYFMIYAVMGAWLVMAVPRLFHFPQLASWQHLLALMLPFILACIFFGMVVSCLVRYRENVMLLIVFASVPLLFLSGISWPQSNIPGIWQGVSWVFPSTFGIRGFVRLNSMGATLHDVSMELTLLWLQTLVYFILACGMYTYQIYLAHHDAMTRLREMRKRQAQSLSTTAS